MAQFDISCTVFDPIRITTKTQIPTFIVDTWYESGLITSSLFQSLPGIDIDGSGQVMMSSGMYVQQPQTHIGIQIKNLRVLPLRVFVVENGPAPLLLGSGFLQLLFEIGMETASINQPRVSIEPPDKRNPDSLGIHLVSPDKDIDTLEFERFIRAIRSIHNVAVIAHTGLHQHNDWPGGERESAKALAVEQTIDTDANLPENSRLKITWVESGSIWVSFTSGSKKALSWLTQIFPKTMDARLEGTMSDATSPEEAAIIQRMTREEIFHAKVWEQRRIAAAHFRATRNEWRNNILEEIDFQRKIAGLIEDPVVRDTTIHKLDTAIAELSRGALLPFIEHLPAIPEKDRDLLPIREKRDRRG